MHLRFALRRLAATPAFSVGAIAVLALGTGATVAVFTVLNALVLKTLPVRHPDQLVAIEVQNARGEPAALPRPLFDTLSQRQRSLAQVTGVLGGSVVSADAGGSVHQAVVDGVTTDYFQLLAVPVVEGRLLSPADYRTGSSDADPVAVIREGYASRMFGTAVRSVGRTIVLGETTVTVVGVTADPFPGIQIGVRTDIVVPAPVVGRIIGLQPNSVPLRYVFGRIAEGHAVEEVRAEWSAIWQSELAAATPPGMGGERRLVVTPGATGVSSWRTRYRDPLQLTLMASAWLLLIACVNLAGLQFARGLRRERDVAVSRALGATGWQVIAPTMVESLLIGLSGLVLGAPLAGWGARFATDLLSTGSAPLALDLAPDWRTWSVVATGFVLVTLGAGLIPAWLATRRVAGLTTTSRVVPGHRRIGSTLVVGQMALAVALLSGAGLMVESFRQIALRDYGFEPDGVVAAQLMNRPGGYTNLNDQVYYRALVDRIVSIPGVSAAALAKPLPGALGAPPAREPVTLSGSTGAAEAGVVFGSPGYFEVLGLAFLSGRPFDWRDHAGSPSVAVVSRALARDLMPDGFRPGLRIDVGRLPHHRGLAVIGIVDDASVLNVRDAAPRVVYLSALQQPAPFARWPGVIVRAAFDALALAPSVAAAVDGLGHEFVVRADTLTGYISRSLAQERLLAGMAGVYGSLALAMVAIGLGALLSQDVTRRRREFGVRLSVGASPAMLYHAVTTRAVRLTTAGIGLGAALTWVLARVQVSALGVESADAPWALAIVTGLLFVVAGGAAAGPALRAARTEPMAALRSE
jgi:predicted permease